MIGSGGDARGMCRAVGGYGMYFAIFGRYKRVVVFAAAQAYSGKSVAYLESLGRIDGQHGCPEVGMQFVEHGVTQSCGTALDDTGDDTADGVALSLDLRDAVGHQPGHPGVGTAHRVALDFGKVVASVVAVECECAHLRGIGCDADADLLQGQACESAGHYAAHRLACRGAAAAAMVAQAVLHLIGEVRVTGTKQVAQIVVVGRMLVLIAYEKTNRTTRGVLLEDAREDFDAVGLAARGRQGALSGPAAVQLVLNVVHVHPNACGEAIDDSPDTLAMALAEGGQAQYVTETVHVQV